ASELRSAGGGKHQLLDVRQHAGVGKVYEVAATEIEPQRVRGADAAVDGLAHHELASQVVDEGVVAAAAIERVHAAAAGDGVGAEIAVDDVGLRRADDGVGRDVAVDGDGIVARPGVEGPA